MKPLNDILSMSVEDIGNSINEERRAVPLTSFNLATESGRVDFLEEYFAWGNERIFEAVSHIWHSLQPPRAARCTGIGALAGTGGTGKPALISLLRYALREALDHGSVLPRPAAYDSVEDWHDAVTRFARDDHAHLDRTLKKYADILNGRVSNYDQHHRCKVITGPWGADASFGHGPPRPNTD